MGVNVFGLKPASETGTYFRATIWQWPELIDYVTTIAPSDLVTTANGLGARAARSLAARLRDEIAAGRTAAHIAAAKAKAESLPDVTCKYCHGTGIRADDVGRRAGYDEWVIGARTPAEPSHPRYGHKGWCNACDGRGSRRPDASIYQLRVETVEAFAAFLADCGGFAVF